MKKIILSVIVFIISTIFIGCSDSSEEVTGMNNLKGIEYEIVDNIPQNIEDIISDIKESRGYMIIESEEKGSYIYIGLGEKSTGGYDIAVEKIENEDNITKITIMEYKPETDSIVTQSITYPYKVINIESIKEMEEIKVVTTKGKELKKIE